MNIVSTLANNLLEEDYTNGVLNILWLFENGKRTIIFAYIELLPNEYPEPYNTEEKPFPISKKLKQHLYFIRIVARANDLIGWYEKALNNEILPMFWAKDKKGNNDFINFETTLYEQEPTYPKMLISNNIPFVGDYSWCVRSNFLFETNLPNYIKDMCLEDEALEWINSQLCFDLSKYPEYIGCISLVAYNPMIRSIDTRLITDEKTGSESSIVHIEPRSNLDISDLKLIYLEKRNLGYSSFKEIPLNKLNFIFENIGEIETTGYAVICPKRGLLLWEDFHGFMKSMVMNMHISTGTKKIDVPSKDLQDVEETYEKEIFSTNTMKIGGDEGLNKSETLSIKLRKAKAKRNQNESSNRNQKLFYDKPKEATLFIREIIAKAETKVIIIDPYITTRELFKFALAVNSNVDVTIMTSALALKGSKGKHANILLKNIENVAGTVKIDAYVMKGKNPAFHDRFIIIDDIVWLSGNSLADIGKRASILVKLENPEQISNLYFDVINDSQKAIKLEDWIANNEANTPNGN